MINLFCEMFKSPVMRMHEQSLMRIELNTQLRLWERRVRRRKKYYKRIGRSDPVAQRLAEKDVGRIGPGVEAGNVRWC